MSLKEGVLINFGQENNGREINHPEIRASWLQWVLDQIKKGGNFNFSLNNRRLSRDEQIKYITQELASRGYSPKTETPPSNAKQSGFSRISQGSSVDAQLRNLVAQQGRSGTQNQPPKNDGSRTYYLAVSVNLPNVNKDEPVVAFSSQKNDINGWEYLSRKGEAGFIGYNQIASAIKRISDETGKPISGNNVDSLFTKYDELQNSSLNVNKPKDKNGIIEDEDGDQLDATKSKGGPTSRPKPEDVRIPPEKMTEYNKKIESDFNQTQENIMIDALAGTGKTTMLKHLSSFIKPGEKWLYLVFNKKNQVESSQAFPSGVDVLTTHSFLGQLLSKSGKEAGGETQLPPEGQKWRKIWKVADSVMSLDWPSIDSHLNYRNRKTGEWTSPFHWKAKSFTTKLADLGKAYALDPTKPETAQQLEKIIIQHGLDPDLSTERINQDKIYTPEMIKMCMEIMRLTMPQALKGRNDEMYNYRDQDDTLWFAALNADKIRWNPHGYKVVLMDEVQDFNECQLIMAQKLREAGCRVIGVGDPNQAMYGFRGANAQAFSKLKDIIGSGQSQALPINFRSGGNIIDWVKNNTHVKNLQAAPHLLGKGAVYADGGTNPPVNYNDFLNSVTNEFQENRKTKEATAIICRTNSPLGHAALHFLKNNVEFQIVGKDLSRDLVDLIKKTTKNKPENVDIENYRKELSGYVEELEERWANKISKRDELKDIKEFAGVLFAVLYFLAEKEYKEDEKSRPITTVKDFQLYLERKLGGLDPDSVEDAAKLKRQDPRKVVTLTTAHKSKGLEWDRVFLMKPSEYNPEKPNIKTQEQAQQEMNAWYVAATRGRNTLMVSGDDEPK